MTEGAPKAEARTVYLLGIIAIVVCVVIIVVMVLVRHRSVLREQQARETGIRSGARVQVVVAKQGPTERTLTITGETRPFVTATLYAKVSGYLKEIPVDKGDRVRQGDLVARIDSPELESQYQAALTEARNKRRFAKRELILVRDGIISQQEADDALAAAKSAEANAAALRSQKQYQIITAPFAGVVTARFADPGALVQSAATGQTSALPVVTVSRIDRLRVYLYLDQKSAGQVKVGDQGVVADAARPGVKLPARVSRISHELDPRSRTMLCELDLPNPDQQLIAGSFVDVTLTVASPPYVELPSTVVYTSEEKSYVAVIGGDNRVRFRVVRIADSDGKMVKLSEGVHPGERLALTPGTGLREGELVQPMAEPKGGQGQAQ
jgi:membrane fusion protein, multidrug efflux system